MLLLIYETKKEVIYRLVKYKPFSEIGYKNGMGWLLLDIQRFEKGKFYSLNILPPTILKKPFHKKIEKIFFPRKYYKIKIDILKNELERERSKNNNFWRL